MGNLNVRNNILENSMKVIVTNNECTQGVVTLKNIVVTYFQVQVSYGENSLHFSDQFICSKKKK